LKQEELGFSLNISTEKKLKEMKGTGVIVCDATDKMAYCNKQKSKITGTIL
jgi:hypothetical protein